MKTLGELGVKLPTSEEATKETVEQLKAKLAYYKENQSCITQEVRSPQSRPYFHHLLVRAHIDGVSRTSQKQKKTTKNSKGNNWQPSSKRKRQTSPVGKIPLQIEDESRDLRSGEIEGLVIVVPRSMEIIRPRSLRKKARLRRLLLLRTVPRRLLGRRRGLLRVHDGTVGRCLTNGASVFWRVSLSWNVYVAVWMVVENSVLYFRGVCICILHGFIITCSLVENTYVFLMESLLSPTVPTTLTRHIQLTHTSDLYIKLKLQVGIL